MRKRYKIFLSIIITLVILLLSFVVYMKHFRNSETKEANKSNIVHNIENYGYTLDDRDTELMKNEFHSLEAILNEEEIDYEKYAQSLSKLFIIDLFTINNKINKYDIGGLEYIYSSEQIKFKDIVLDTIYMDVLDNTYHSRNQKLPEVKTVNVLETNKSSYQKDGGAVESIIVTVAWEYVEDFGYDNKANITLISDNNQLYVVEYSPVVEGE